MFLTIRGITSLANDYALPTCLSMLNIFHPVRRFFFVFIREIKFEIIYGFSTIQLPIDSNH